MHRSPAPFLSRASLILFSRSVTSVSSSVSLLCWEGLSVVRLRMAPSSTIDRGDRTAVGIQETVLAREVIAAHPDDGLVHQPGNHPELVEDLVSMLDQPDVLVRPEEVHIPSPRQSHGDQRRENEPVGDHSLEGKFQGAGLVMQRVGIDITSVRDITTI